MSQPGLVLGGCRSAASVRPTANSVSLLNREADDELSLEPGTLVVAAIKATNVSVEISHTR